MVSSRNLHGCQVASLYQAIKNIAWGAIMKDLRTGADFRVQHLLSVKSAFFALMTITVFSMAAPAWCQATDNMLQDYKAGNYVQLLADCDKVLAKDPNNAAVHYYRATAWAKMGVGIQAETEYKTALKLTHDPHLQQYCQTALATYQNPANSQASAAPLNGAPAGRAVPPGNAQTSPGSLIEQQADSLSLAALDQAGTAHATFNQVSQQANAMKMQADATANNMANQYSYDRNGRKYPVYTQAQIDAARQQGYDNAADLVTRSKIQTDAAYETAKLKAFETQASAAALRRQLQSGPKGSVHLLEPGTNFFVRNYATDPTPPNINPAHAHIGDDAALAATQKSLQEISHPGSRGVAKGQSSATTEVEGKLLKSGSQ
jgi:hypothetical protein